MKIRIFGAIILILFAKNLFAETKNTTDTIPFVNYQSRIIYPSINIPNTSVSIPKPLNQGMPSVTMSSNFVAVEQTTTTSKIPTTEVQQLILQVRNAVCSSVGDADVRVWLSLDASGKLLGVGASTQSGFEVTFHCKAKP